MRMRLALVALFGALVLVALSGRAEAQVGTASCRTASANFCGGYAGNCWCDDACVAYRDCCRDRTESCEIANMVITSVTPPVVPTSFAGNLTIKGLWLYEYDAALADVTVTVGGVNCMVLSVADQQVVCALGSTPPNTTVSLTSRWKTLVNSAVVKIPGTTTSSTALAFQPPTITTISPAMSPTVGGATLTLAGSSFGAFGSLPASVTVGGKNCTVLTQTHTQLTCLIPPGAGSTLPVVVTRGGQSSQPVNFSYTPPTLTAVTPSLLPTAGGVITLTGTNFGPTGAAVAVGGVSCPIVSQTHTQIVCTAQPGPGGGAAVQVSVLGYPANEVEFIEYQRPTITAVSPTTGPMAGNTPITITGTNFGTSGSVTIAGSACLATAWSHTSITCLTPAGQYASSVQVTRAAQRSNNATYTYVPPPVCAANQYVVGGMSCQACAAGTMSPGGTVTSCQAIVCPAPQQVNLATNSCACPAAPPGFYITDAMTCATSEVAATLFLRAECVEPDPVMPGTNIVHFGYFNNYEPGGPQLPRSYGSGSNTLTVDGVDVGPLSGAPDAIEYGARNNVFALRYTPGQQIVWSVLDPITNTMATASPAAGTPACTTLVAGPQGPQGEAGANGANGLNGVAGPFGFTGASGLAGPIGLPGEPGVMGAAGPKGPAGLTGQVGPNGDKGPAGDAGPEGPQGPQGAQGPQGIKGAMGDAGATGPVGVTGAQGPIGTQGPQGAVGAVGPLGEKGQTGDTGATGSPGDQGPTGARGLQGLPGPAGAMGPQGPKGPAGVVAPGFEIYLRGNEPAPTGYTLVRSYVEKLEKKEDRSPGRDDRDKDDKGEKRDDKGDKEIVIRVYRKNP